MPQIDYFLATLSPNVYMAGLQLEEVAAKHGATVRYRPLDVMALFGRTGGTPPKDRHPSRQEYRLIEMRRKAKLNALDINLKPAFWPSNGAPSAYAIIAAQNAGGGDVGKLVFALTRACWAEEKNIAEDDVISACLAEAGFDPTLAAGMMVAEAEEYSANLEEAVNRGVFGLPFYIAGEDERFWGEDRIEHLDLHLSGKL